MAMANHFGIALRGWRERLSPSRTGVAPGPQATERRGRGLRREELARLAGLSVDYVVRLEQGRARNPSAQVVTALARALRLDPSERDHLFRCAGLAPPPRGDVPLRVPLRVHRLVDRLGRAPVAVFAADWTLIGWNGMWTAALGDPGAYGWDARSLVTGMFRQSPAGVHRPDPLAAWPVRSWEGDAAEEEALVADLRVTAAAYPSDARLAALTARMLRTSPRFADLWFTGTARALVGDRKTVEHPLVGDLVLDLDVLTVPGADLRIVTYAAAGSADTEKLDALRATCPPRRGLQDRSVAPAHPVVTGR
ncbi:helix-turn-helix transcriptional regulator [Streptomyces sp. NPDC059092]|uniref:helix-turn-helix transcriptional regulator n=1 Tax=Streptomyces sp. NPDC059092 TaxID=3346725 RepID=UPI0036D0CDD3